MPTRFAWFLLVVLTIAGCRGREATPASTAVPQRIVSQTVVSDEILWELGEDVRRRVVGVSRMADDPSYSGVVDVWPKDVLRVSGTSEALVAARPDLVVLADFSAAETRTLLAHTQIPTVELDGFDGFEAFRRHVRAVAEAVDARPQGEALVQRFDDALARHSVPPPPDAPAVISWVDGMVAGLGTTFDDQARAAGMINVAARHGLRGHNAVSLEQLTTWDPDLIVTPCQGDCTAARERVASLPGLHVTKAARAGRIVAIESRILFSTGLDMVGVVERLRGNR